MAKQIDEAIVHYLGAETHRLIAEDFDLDMPIETRMRLFDIADQMDALGRQHESRGD